MSAIFKSPVGQGLGCVYVCGRVVVGMGTGVRMEMRMEIGSDRAGGVEIIAFCYIALYTSLIFHRPPGEAAKVWSISKQDLSEVCCPA